MRIIRKTLPWKIRIKDIIYQSMKTRKKEVVNDCEEIMGIVRDIYSEYNGIQEADQNTAEQMMNRMKENYQTNGNPVIGSDHYSVMDNYQKMETIFKIWQNKKKKEV